jgi:hypothetical protein
MPVNLCHKRRTARRSVLTRERREFLLKILKRQVNVEARRILTEDLTHGVKVSALLRVKDFNRPGTQSKIRDSSLRAHR